MSAWRRACATSCCAQQLAGSTTHVGLGSRGARGGGRRQRAARSITWPGCPGSGEPPPLHDGPLGLVVPADGPNDSPTRSTTNPAPALRMHAVALPGLPSWNVRSFRPGRPAQAATGRNLLRASATPAVDPDVACRRKKLQFSSSSGRCSADLVQAEADADCY